jgi:hypothetical protein
MRQCIRHNKLLKTWAETGQETQSISVLIMPTEKEGEVWESRNNLGGGAECMMVAESP